jgi:hypothetical protein
MSRDVGWDLPTLLAGPSVGLLVSAAAAPWIGRLLDRGYGQLVMASGGVVGAVGLAGWAASYHPAAYLASWLVIGAAQAMALYEPAFALLTLRYRTAAQSAVLRVTLLGGFAGTLAAPLATWALSSQHWRTIVAAGAVILLGLVAPLNWRFAPVVGKVERAVRPDPVPDNANTKAAMGWLAAGYGTTAAVTSVMTFLLIPVLSQRGLGPAVAASVYALMGPSQVAARLFLLLGPRLTATKLSLVCFGLLPLSLLGLFLFPTLLLWASAVTYGVANGMQTILRPALTRRVFGSAGFGLRSGLLAMPQAVLKAGAPLVAGWIWMGGEGVVVLAGSLLTLTLAGAMSLEMARRSVDRP